MYLVNDGVMKSIKKEEIHMITCDPLKVKGQMEI